MKGFKTHYIDGVKHVNVPLYFENIFYDENGDLVANLAKHQLPNLVDEGLIVLKKNGKNFTNFNEALSYSTQLLSEAEEDEESEDEKDDAKASADKEAKEEEKSAQKVGGMKWVDETGKEHDFEYSLGNSKIGTDTVIINMSSATDCMSLTLGLCSLGSSGQCYALSPERRYPETVLKYRRRQEKQWSCMTAIGISEALKMIKKKMPSIKYVRLNEAGEFRNLPKGDDNPLRALAKKQLSPETFASLDKVDDIKKVSDIARAVPELTFYTYTHRNDLFPDGKPSGLGENVVLNGSGFMVDNAFKPVSYSDFVKIMDQIKATKNKRVVVPGYGVLENVTDCLGNCAVCDKCKVHKGFNIILPTHGSGTEKNKAMSGIRNRILKDENFTKVLLSDISTEDKVKKLLKMGDALDPNQDLKYLFRVIPDRKEWWESLVQGEEAKIEFLNALIGSIDPISPDVLNPNPNLGDKKQALRSSVKALEGKLKDEFSDAVAKGKETTIAAKERAIEQLKKLQNLAQDQKLTAQNISKSMAKKFKTANKKVKELKKKHMSKPKRKFSSQDWNKTPEPVQFHIGDLEKFIDDLKK